MVEYTILLEKYKKKLQKIIEKLRNSNCGF